MGTYAEAIFLTTTINFTQMQKKNIAFLISLFLDGGTDAAERDVSFAHSR